MSDGDAFGDALAHGGSDSLSGEHKKERSLHPLQVVVIFVAEFLEIHPFQDGEGRLSRLLTTLLLLRAGYGWAPYSSLDHVIEQEKEAYDSALQRTQGAVRAEGAPPDWTLWLEFFLKALRLQQERLKGICSRAGEPEAGGLEASFPRMSAATLVTNRAAAALEAWYPG